MKKFTCRPRNFLLNSLPQYGIFASNLVKSQLSTEASYFFNSFQQRLCIFSKKLSNDNKQRLYKIKKCPTSLFYHVLLIKQNECKHIFGSTVYQHNFLKYIFQTFFSCVILNQKCRLFRILDYIFANLLTYIYIISTYIQQELSFSSS